MIEEWRELKFDVNITWSNHLLHIYVELQRSQKKISTVFLTSYIYMYNLNGDQLFCVFFSPDFFCSFDLGLDLRKIQAPKVSIVAGGSPGQRNSLILSSFQSLLLLAHQGVPFQTSIFHFIKHKIIQISLVCVI